MIVVGCGKQKLDRAAPARELYTGSLFCSARRYAEASGRSWVILSGAHGVISPDRVIRPYNAGPPEGGEALRLWAVKAAMEIIDRRLFAADEIAAQLERGEFPGVEILAGARYAEPLAAELRRFLVPCRLPLAGLGTGYRRQRLNLMAEKLHRA